MHRLEWVFALIDRTTGPARRIAKALQTIRGGLGGISLHSKAAENTIGHTIRQVEGLSRALGNVSVYPLHRLRAGFDETRARAERLRASIIGLAASGAALGGATLLGRSIINGVAALEQERIALSTLLKSPRRGEAALQWAISFADRTPFETEEVLTSLRRALAMGFSTTQMETLLTTLGDTAAATGSKLDDLILIFGQMRAAGRVASDEMNQLAERTIPAWSYLAQALGKGIPEVKKLVEEGKITADVGMRAIFRGLQRDFAGMMEQQSKTIKGLISTLRSRPTAVMFELDRRRALEPVKQFLSNLVALTDFSRPPGSRIREQLVTGLQRIFDTLFKPLAQATEPARAEELLERVLSGIQRFVATIQRVWPVVRSAVEGFTSGFAMFFSGLAAVWQGVQRFFSFFGIHTSQGAKGMAHFLGQLIGLVVAWRILNAVTLGGVGALVQFVSVGLTRLPTLLGLFGGLGARIAGIGATALTSMGPVTIAVLAIGAALVLLIRHWGDVQNAVKRTWDAIQAGVGIVWNVIGAIMRLPSTVLGALSGLGSAVLEALKKATASAITSLRELASRIPSALWEGIKAGVSTIAKIGKGAGEALLGAFKAILGIRSPSRAFAYVGRMSMAGLVMGLLSSAPLVAQAAETVSTQAMTSVPAPVWTVAPVLSPPAPVEVPAIPQFALSNALKAPLSLPAVATPKLPELSVATPKLPELSATVRPKLPQSVKLPAIFQPEALLLPQTPQEHLPPLPTGVYLPKRAEEEKTRAALPPTRERPSITVNIHITVNTASKTADPDALGTDIARAVEKHLVALLERIALEEGGDGLDA